jgi:hypothetical protein
VDELVDQIIRRTEIEEEQARVIIRMVEAHEHEQLLHTAKIDDDASLNQPIHQDGLESLSGRGFLG